MHTAIPLPLSCKRAPWNKGRLIGQKRPLKPKDVWAIRVRLQLEGRKRDLALFNLPIDSKLRDCDLVRLQVNRRLRRRPECGTALRQSGGDDRKAFVVERDDRRDQSEDETDRGESKS